MTDNLPARTTPAAPAVHEPDSWVSVVADVAKLAEYVASTEFVPASLRTRPAAVAAAILYGRETGLPPMTALSQIHVIEGRPSMSAEGMRALILAAGHEIVVGELTGAKCTMRGRRRGSEEWSTVTWSLDMARAAGLLDKKGQSWSRYPRAMLAARCTAELARLIFPDVIHGFRATEELDEVEDETAFGAPTATPSTTKVARKTTKARKATQAPPTPPAVESPGHDLPLPGEAGFEALAGPAGSSASISQGEPESSPSAPTGEGVAEPDAPTLSPPSSDPVDDRREAAGEPPPAPISKAQLRMLHATFNRLGLAGEDARDRRLWIVSTIVGRPVDSTATLSRHDGSAVIDTVAKAETVDELEEILAAIVDTREGDDDE